MPSVWEYDSLHFLFYFLNMYQLSHSAEYNMANIFRVCHIVRGQCVITGLSSVLIIIVVSIEGVQKNLQNFKLAFYICSYGISFFWKTLLCFLIRYMQLAKHILMCPFYWKYRMCSMNTLLVLENQFSYREIMLEKHRLLDIHVPIFTCKSSGRFACVLD